jgi:serine/threonine protein kinase
VEEGGVALMMEYMDGGSLQDLADSGGCSDEGVLANIAVQGLAGLDFLHKCNQIHRGMISFILCSTHSDA